jgi:sec-independent protein translocase protein TatC
MMAAALPLVVLYEISVIMSKMIYKKMQKQEQNKDIIKP